MSPKETCTAQQKRTNKIPKVEETCKQIQEQTITEKRNAQAFVEKTMTLIEAKTQGIVNKVEKQEIKMTQTPENSNERDRRPSEITESTVKKKLKRF